MSKGFAVGCGLGSLMLLAILMYNDIQTLFGLPGLPRVISTLMVLVIAILANAFVTYRIVRGTKLDPSYTKDELRELMREAARTVVREELELAVGRTYVDMAGLVQDSTPQSRPAPKPYIVRAREGD